MSNSGWKLSLNPRFFGLYAAYMFSCLGSRTWTFAIIFILARLGGTRLVTINQLLQSVCQMVFASKAGNWYDTVTRIRGIQTFLSLNNMSVAVSSLLLGSALTIAEMSPSSFLKIAYAVCLVGAIAFCAVSIVASNGERMALSKDWLIVLVSSEKGDLSVQNSVFTVIDMAANIISPTVAGLVLQHVDLRTCCWLAVAWNVIIWIGEAIVLYFIFKAVPQLSVKKNAVIDEEAAEQVVPLAENEHGQKMGHVAMFKTFFGLLQWPAAVALALLYMTVLAFDGISLSYGEREGFNVDLLGLFQSLGSVCGLIGALSFPILVHKLSLSTAGFIGLAAESAALVICVASVFIPGSPADIFGYFSSTTFSEWLSDFIDTFRLSDSSSTPASPNKDAFTSLLVLYIGIIMARYGLWLADLAINQILQESVADVHRGTVFGVSTALQQFFSVAKDLLAIALPDPRTFGLLVFVSMAAVLAANALYAFYLLKVVLRRI